MRNDGFFSARLDLAHKMGLRVVQDQKSLAKSESNAQELLLISINFHCVKLCRDTLNMMTQGGLFDFDFISI